MNDPDRNDETVAAARDWVVHLASGEPTAAEIRRLEAWLAQSPAHRQAFETERRFWQRLGALEATAKTGHAPPRRRPRRILVAGTLAAACLAGFVLFGDWLTIALVADYHTAEGAQQTIALPDGSLAHLNTDTALTVAYGEAERRLHLLQGEALFEVHADRQRPFRVDAAGGVVEAVGTSFVVRSVEGEALIAVTEGAVTITSPEAGQGGGATRHLAPGERSGFRRGDPPQPAQPFDPAMAAPWRQGLILIDDLPLDQALAELDRYRPGRILLIDGDSPLQSVSGAFTVDGVDAAIAGLAATHGLTVTPVTPYLLILR